MGGQAGKRRMVGVACEELRKQYGSVRALDGVSFTVAPGKVLALLGANGSGKTTTVRILTTLAAPDSGCARVDGMDVAREASRVRRAIGLTAQETIIDRFLTGAEYMHLVARLRQTPRSKRRSEVAALLAEFGLTEVAPSRVATYSGGMRRRLDLASSFIGQPSVLFLDEPSNGLDPRSRQNLWDAIRRRADDGATVVITTQYMEEADALADLVVVLDRGRVIATGAPSDLKDEMGGRMVELTLARPGDVALASTLLADAGIQSTTNERPGALHFVLPTVCPALLIALRSLDTERIHVSDVMVRQATLDEVFIRLTADADDDYVVCHTAEGS